VATLEKYLFRSLYTKNPKNSVLRIFSFVPTGTTSFAVVRFANLAHATSFDRQVNIIAACDTNERG